MSWAFKSRTTHGDVVWSAVMWSALSGAVWMKLGPACGLPMFALTIFFVRLAHRNQEETAEFDARQEIEK